MNSFVAGRFCDRLLILLLAAAALPGHRPPLNSTAASPMRAARCCPASPSPRRRPIRDSRARVVTDDTGAWVMPNLPTGPYRLEVSLQGFKTLRADRHRAAGRRHADDQYGRSASATSRRRCRLKPPRRIVDVRSAGISEVVEQERIVELPLQGRQVTDLIVAGGRRDPDGPAEQPQLPGRREHLGRGRPRLRRRVHARRRHAQRRPERRRPAAPVPRCAAGVPRGDERPVGGERHALGRVGERRHQVGHQPLHGNAFEFLRDHRFNATSPFAADRPGRQACRRRAAAQPVRRHGRRTDRPGQAVFLRRATRARRPA